MIYKKFILPNGLRVIQVPSRATKAVTVLVLVGTGSKYETKEQNGISHFLEHLFFKGTKKRPDTLAIAEPLDKIGGVYNAFTSKEYTGYFAKVPKEHFGLALDWVSDIFLNSKLERAEIDKERGVILEEINMYLDTPSRYVVEVWDKLLYGDQPAGWEIIGAKENIAKFQRKDFVDYMTGHYKAENTLVCVSGNFNQKEVLSKIQKAFKTIAKDKAKIKEKTQESQQKPAVSCFFKETDQTHLCLGARGYDIFHPQKWALELMAVVLGGNMSSRLFLEVREKRGLAYYVKTESENFTDSGYFMTQAGIPHNKVLEVASLIQKEYKDIKENGISAGELKKAKDFIKGSMALSLEACDALASFYASQETLTAKILTPEQVQKQIEKVSLADIRKVARDIFTPEKLNLALVGPHKNQEELQKNLLI